MLLPCEAHLRLAIKDFILEWDSMYMGEDINPLRAPYWLVESLIEATLRDDIASGYNLHGGAYMEDINIAKIVLLELEGKIDISEANNEIQKGIRKYLTDYVVQEVYDYVD